MKILFAHVNFPGQYERLAAYFAGQSGHQVVALLDTANATGRSLAPIRLCAYHARPFITAGLTDPEKSLLADIRRGEAVATAAAQLRKEGFYPDVILAHGGAGDALLLADVFPRARTIVYCEFYPRISGNIVGFDPEFGPPATLAYAFKLMRMAPLASLDSSTQGVSPTNWQRMQFPPEYHSKIAVVHDGVDTARIAPDGSARFRVPDAGITLCPEDEVVTYVSRSLEPFRGFHTFLRAVPEIQARRPRARIVVVGSDSVSYSPPLPGGETYRSRMLKELGGRLDPSRLHFTGPLPYQEYLTLLKVSTAHAYLTYPYVLSWSFTEALAAGCLIVGSRTAPVEEVITDRVNGILVDFFAPGEVAERIVEALGNRNAMRALREAARRTAVERYDFETACLPQHLRLIGGA